MNPNLLNQELARHKHAEILRDATRRYAAKVDTAPEEPERKPRRRWRRRPVPASA